MVPATEIYSIDECFADLSGVQENLTQFGRKMRSRIFQFTGIPVGVGIAGTKTLAKLANHTAKCLQAQTGGVVDITDPFKRDWVLRNTEVKEVWGIGRRMTAHLEAMGIHTAMDLAKLMPGRCGRNSVWWWRRLPASSQARRAWNWTTPTPRSRKFAAAGCSASG